MAELLLELFSEEIPARMQTRAAADLQRLMETALKEAGLEFQNMRAFATPRRLTLVAGGLPARQPDITEERKGPKADAPQKAVDGFLRSVGLTIDQVEKRDTPKGAVLYAVIERKGRATADVIAEIVPDLVRKFPWPKSMRWGSRSQGTGSLRWVRPLHSVLCLLGGKPVAFDIDGIKSGNETRGHRFMGPDTISIKSFEDYEKSLRKAHVVLDTEERKRLILNGVNKAAAKAGLELIEDAGLLDEVAGLVEWPVALIGRFDKAFLELPPEVLTTAMRTHQKYFALRDTKTGKLANAFAVIANLEADDGGTAIVQGNERVLRARLSDAKFFWDQDRKRTLASRVTSLIDIVFRDAVTLEQKTLHVQDLAEYTSKTLGFDTKLAAKAAYLAKADLTTSIVYEFPELQGVIGRYYALNDHEDQKVANAIRDHYLPQGPDDPCPSEPVSIVVALSDKVYTLVHFWIVNEKPTGSKDPYALRRAALGVIRIILENSLRFKLLPLFREAAKPFKHIDLEKLQPEPTHNLLSFFADRLKVYLRDRGARHDLIDAVFALRDENGNPPDDLVLIVRRVEALGDFLDTEDGANLLAGYKRAANILKIEEKKDGQPYRGPADPSLFADKEEGVLFDRIAEASAEAKNAVEREDFAAAMAAIATLRAPVDRFFDTVTVNADDKAVRANRLKLLSQIRDALAGVADFSRIEG